MGVVYKLKPEVIYFIVAYKRDNPSISCRRLADMASEKFNVKISKSSVNSILKTSELSNPVGRPVGATGSKNFKIPKAKKEQMLKNIQKAEKKEKSPSKPKTKKEKVDPKEKRDRDREQLRMVIDEIENKLAESKGVEQVEETKQVEQVEPTKQIEQVEEVEPIEQIEQAESIEHQEPDEQPSLLPDPVEETSFMGPGEGVKPSFEPQDIEDKELEDYMAEARVQLRDIAAQNLEGMGLVFLKAALLAVSQKGILGPILSRHLNNDDELYFDRLSEAAVYIETLRACGIASNNNYEEYGFWRLLGFNEPPNSTNFNKQIEELEVSPRLAFEYFGEKSQLSLEVSSYRISLDDGTVLIFDAGFNGCWNQRPKAQPIPLNLGILNLSKRIISNTWPVILKESPTRDNEIFIDDVISVFEKDEHRQMAKVVLLDAKEHEIAAFGMLPTIKRHFITLAQPTMKGFDQWQNHFDDSLLRCPYYVQSAGRNMYFRAVKRAHELDRTKHPVDLLFIEIAEMERGEPKAIIVTNNAGDKAEETIDQYFGFTGGEIGASGGLAKDGGDWSTHPAEGDDVYGRRASSLKSGQDLIKDLSQMLQRYVRYFFGASADFNKDINDYLASVYESKGGVAFDGKKIHVVLNAPPDPQKQELVEYFAAKCNKLGVFDEQDRKIFVSTYK